MAEAIWKDKIVNIGGVIGSSSSVLYRIRVGNTTIYEGKAYNRPGDGQVKIKVNDICADYINNVLPTLSQAAFEAITLPVTFTIQVYSSLTWNTIGTIQFYNDWSYDYSFNPSTMGLAHPVNGKVSANGWLIYTAYNQTSVTATLYFTDGTSQNVIIPIAKSNDFNDDFNEDFSRATASAGSGSATIDLSQWEGLAKVKIGNTNYIVDGGCNRYALHYLNAYGGWDSLLIEGNHLEQDTFTRTTQDVEYNNTSSMNRGTKVIATEVAKSWTLHTGWLNDDESERMHHLLGSTDVYLEDTLEGRFHPVTITNSSLDHKTYRNNGNKLVNYEINVALAAERLRR